MSKIKKRMIIIISIVLAVIIVLAIAGCFVLRHFTAPARQPGEITADAVVQTDKGALQGRTNNGVYNFLGVEYAVAEKLFQPAEEVGPWEGVKDATEYGPSSMQSNFLGDFGAWVSGVKYDNNCQNLNIWTPENAENAPVMVWLHGGGFSTGSAYAMAAYNGENLARTQNLVVVSVNHRLNILGHLDLSAYGEEYRYSANVGIYDIVQSLEWIQRNISAFGCDPDNVTLFGQSGGGAKILALMTSPYAKGLFDKAIVQSGATETVGVSFTEAEASRAITDNILGRLGISGDNIGEIQNVTYHDMMRAGDAALAEVGAQFSIPAPFGGYGMEWEPVVDGDFIPSHPVTEDGFAENGRDIPLLIGSNLYEWTRYMSSEQVDVTPEIETAFQEAYPNEPISDARYTDTLIRLPMLKIMSHKADQKGANVYSYLYTYGTSNHGAEIENVFANGSGYMSDTMSQIWADFARTGVPSAEGLPEWETYTRESGACMILDEECYLAHHHDDALMKLIKPDYVW